LVYEDMYTHTQSKKRAVKKQKNKKKNIFATNMNIIVFINDLQAF